MEADQDQCPRQAGGEEVEIAFNAKATCGERRTDVRPTASEPRKPAGAWRKAIAAILDFIFIFFGGGYVIGYFTGDLTEGGFKLNGAPAFLLFAVIILYFIIFRRYLGGTVFQRLLGAY